MMRLPAVAKIFERQGKRRAGADGSGFDSEIRQALTQRLFSDVAGNFFANFLSAGVIAAVFWKTTPSHSLVAWFALSQVINATGALVVIAFHRRQHLLELRQWVDVFSVYVALDAIMWGLSAFIFINVDDPIRASFLIINLLANVAGATTSFVTFRQMFIIFNTIAVLMVGITLLFSGNLIFVVLAPLSLVYWFIMFNLGTRFNKNIITSLRLQFELQESEAELKQSRDFLEERVQERTHQLSDLNQELSKREALYRAVVEVQSELLFRFTPAGNLTFANEAFCRFFGIPAAAIAESSLGPDGTAGVLAANTASQLREMAQNLTQATPAATTESHGPSADGRTRWLLWTLKGLFNDNGTAVECQGVAIDITERKEAERHIAFIAHHDALTGLPNRHLFRERLEQATGADSHGQAAVVMLDLDGFKEINDSLGHVNGDVLLCQAASRIQNYCGTDATVSRLGGDEFGVIMRNVESDDAVAIIVERIIQQLEMPIEIEGHWVRVGASAGIAMYPGDATLPDQLIKNADLSLNRAKERGRATYVFYSSDLAMEAERRIRIITGLRHALESDALDLAFQPKIRIEDGKVVGSEALVRWTDKIEGPISPAEFIPIAETAGLSVPIGDWVVRNVCRQLAAWRDAGHPLLPVSVNLSAVQFSDQKLLSKVNDALSDYQVAPHIIEFEITETALMTDMAQALETMEALVGIGFKLSIDDFGVGYSSFGYLRSMPVSVIKIDRTFVSDVVQNEESHAILRAMIDLGHSLGLRVLTEGVETLEQYVVLEAIGCDMVQGYFTGRPAPAEQFMAATEARGFSEPGHTMAVASTTKLLMHS